MPRIELDKGISYFEAKKMAGSFMANALTVNSVRIVVEKETHKMYIEYTEFSQKTIDRLVEV